MRACAAARGSSPSRASPPRFPSPAPLPFRTTPIPPQNLTTMDDSAASSSFADAAPEEPPPMEPPPPLTCDPQTLARWYQLEALERAVRENTVAFLETGAGKTLIAVLLLRAYAHRVRRPARAFAVFLVPTVVLVGQQARVVQVHTDLRVEQFYGAMGVDFWDAATWRRVVDDAEVLVMTPQILLDNLRHSFFRLQDIALLIFDECHHAKGDSPYACIFKEFYHPQLNSRPSDPLPRIFGMTASLIYSKSLDRANYSKQISELKNLMNSKVYTVECESALLEYIPFATTKIVQYDDSIISSELHDHIISCLYRLEAKHLELLKGKLHGSSLEHAKQRISRLNKTFLYCTANLGVWLAAKAAEVQSSKESFLSFWGEELDKNVESSVINYSEEVYRELLRFSKRGYIGEDFAADLQDGLLTSKVHCLIQSLLEYRHMQDLRCIVFVERVITSIVLESLLSTVRQMSGWTVKYMAGDSSSLQHQSRKTHMEIIDSFRRGKVHLIIATQILEEGLDVPSCNLVIRFDPPATVCSFIQSRGRARMQNSDYVLLVRRGDAEALSKTEKFLSSGQIMREESLRLASTSCQPLENTLFEEEYYRVESTGAIVTLNSSVPLIYFFCSKLPSDEYFKPLPRFKIDKAFGTCTLHLPKSSPVQTVNTEGEISVLKQAVCLKACRELHAIGALTDSLLPELGVPCEEEPDIEPSDTHAVELPPELCRFVMSPVLANTLCSFSYIPSIMYRIQCMLLSVKLKVQLGPRMQQFTIPALKILEAVTTKECQEEFSQESLETLGDSFLKYVTTQHLYSKYKLHHEGILTKMKKNLISNAALCQLACNNNLVGYIQGEEFNPKNWIIPGLGYDTYGHSKIFCLSPNDMYSLRKMSIKSKRIADTVEALIGTYLSAAGEQAAFLFIKSLGMDIEFHTEIPVERKITTKPEEFINVGSLEIILGYDFSDPSLLMEALTHGSYQIAGTTACYQVDLKASVHISI